MLTVLWVLILFSNNGEPNGQRMSGLRTEESCELAGHDLVPVFGHHYECKKYRAGVGAVRRN
jgi:hypothetical protein